MLTFIFPTFLGMCPNPPDVLLSWIEYFRVPDVFVSVTSYQILYIYILFNLDCTITQIQFFCCAVSMCGPPLSTSLCISLCLLFTHKGGKAPVVLRTGPMTSGFLRRPGSMSFTQGLETWGKVEHVCAHTIPHGLSAKAPRTARI